MQDVRDKKGLTYGIDTALSPMDHGGVIVGQAATDNPKTKEAWDIALSTMRHFYDDGVTPAEINAAKDYLTGSLPLYMTSTDRIAGVMVSLQLQHRASDYLDKRNDLVRNVTADEVQAAIRHWFNPDRLTLSMVGKPDGMTPTETRPLVRE
jgi:zinc protease